MRVMSFNLRHDNPNDHGHLWTSRRHAVRSILEEFKPDLLGIQEGLTNQIDELQCWLDEHMVLGRGREADLGGEHCSIFFETRVFELLDSGDFWLSETPDVPGSKSWETCCPRMATWALLRNIEHDRKILFLNTHLDHVSELARVKGAELILGFVSSFAGADGVVITGDFNDEASGVIRQFTESNGYIDALAAVNKTGATYHGFTGEGSARIDYVLISKAFEVMRGEVITDKPGGILPSDHFPVYADLRMRLRV